MMLMTLSQTGIDFIKKFEELKLYAYRDSVGVPTIGYGHTNGVYMGMAITQKQAEDLFKEDVTPIEKMLNGMGINFRQGQFDALCSWMFNLGIGKFNSSTMKRYIVAKNADIDITDQMVRWHNAGGKPLLGLKRRRCAEANMWLGRDVYYVDAKGQICKR